MSTPRAHRPPGWPVAVAAAFTLLRRMEAALPFLRTLWGSLKLEGDFFSLTGWRDALRGPRTLDATGGRFTLEACRDVWIGEAFRRPALDTVPVRLGVAAASLMSPRTPRA